MSGRALLAKSIHAACQSCARAVYGSIAPNDGYAGAVAQLLFGTIAHESAMFTATRQHGFSWTSHRGAWGLCQCEMGSVRDSLDLLRARPDLAKRAAVWLNSDADADLDVLLLHSLPEHVLRMLPFSERLSVLFCRLHYLRIMAPVPRDLAGQDAYYKRFYNTIHGAAKPGDYTKALSRAMALLEE